VDEFDIVDGCQHTELAGEARHVIGERSAVYDHLSESGKAEGDVGGISWGPAGGTIASVVLEHNCDRVAFLADGQGGKLDGCAQERGRGHWVSFLSRPVHSGRDVPVRYIYCW